MTSVRLWVLRKPWKMFWQAIQNYPSKDQIDIGVFRPIANSVSPIWSAVNQTVREALK